MTGSFDVAADSYGRFMGRFSEPLAEELATVLELGPGQTALDVGCGPGALTAALADRLGAASVCAVDPSASFVAALHGRLPDVDVRRASAERLPFPGGRFDRTVAQLVVHFMTDPVAGVAEMARVTKPGGLVAACVWDHAGDRGPLSLFWRAVREIDPDARDESGLAGAREGHLAELFEAAGLSEVVASALTVRVGYESVEEWWEPYTLGVGPAGAHVSTLEAPARDRLRRQCASLLPQVPFEITASAWTAVGRPRT